MRFVPLLSVLLPSRLPGQHVRVHRPDWSCPVLSVRAPARDRLEIRPVPSCPSVLRCATDLRFASPDHETGKHFCSANQTCSLKEVPRGGTRLTATLGG